MKRLFCSCIVLIGLISFLSKGESMISGPQVYVVRVPKDSAQLEYRVSISKDTFFVYESITAEIWLKNISSKTMRVHFHPDIGWIVRDQTGKSFRPNFSISQYPPELKPGDSLGGYVDLPGYGVRMLHKEYPYTGLPYGQYSAYYKMDKDSTPVINFWIVEPMGEEAEALKLYLNAFSFAKDSVQMFPESLKSLSVEQVTKFILVADRYPNSVYANKSLGFAYAKAWALLDDKELELQIILRQLRDYPDNPMNYGLVDLLKAYYEAKKDTASYRAELVNLLKRNPHPKLISKTKEALRKLENKE